MREVYAIPGMKIFLGRCGENMASCVVFDISEWQTTYGEGTVQLIHQRNGDKTPYPCVIEQNSNVVTWCITDSDVAVAGRGRAELQYYVGDTLVKSDTHITITERALGTASETPPEPYESWMENMLGMASETQENAEAAAQSAEAADTSAEAAANSADNADESRRLAELYKQDAKSEADRAEAEAEAAVAEAAARAEEAVQPLVNAAEASANEAAESAGNAAESAAKAERSVSAAASEADRAKAEADRAAGAVGGDFATRSDAQAMADKAESNANKYTDEAEANANKYTDQKVSGIPAPDVSGQIGEHNTSSSAHSDIRILASNAQSKADAAATAAAAAQSTADSAASAAAEAKNIANSKQDAATAINTSNIGQQSVNYATSAGQLYNSSCGALTWGGDHMLSAAARPKINLHFGDNDLFCYNAANGTYHTILDAGNSNKTKLVSTDTTPAENNTINWTYK